MVTRRFNLGRTVIIAGGLLVFLALLSNIWASSDRPGFWTAVYVCTLAGLAGWIALGRALGERWAMRRGTDIDEGRRSGVSAAAITLAVALAIWRWMTGV